MKSWIRENPVESCLITLGVLLVFMVVSVTTICFVEGFFERKVKYAAIQAGLNPFMTVNVHQDSK